MPNASNNGIARLVIGLIGVVAVVSAAGYWAGTTATRVDAIMAASKLLVDTVAVTAREAVERDRIRDERLERKIESLVQEQIRLGRIVFAMAQKMEVVSGEK